MKELFQESETLIAAMVDLKAILLWEIGRSGYLRYKIMRNLVIKD